MVSRILKKKGMIYLPFLMVLILIFGFVVNSNYITKDIDVYLQYEEINDVNEISEIENFINQLEIHKNSYYEKVDLGLIKSDLSFLDYVKKENLKLFKGNFSILNFTLGNKVNLNGDKVVLYYSDKNEEGYYFYAKEHGRNINLSIARIFRA